MTTTIENSYRKSFTFARDFRAARARLREAHTLTEAVIHAEEALRFQGLADAWCAAADAAAFVNNETISGDWWIKEFTDAWKAAR